jgi:hypothetical protein
MFMKNVGHDCDNTTHISVINCYRFFTTEPYANKPKAITKYTKWATRKGWCLEIAHTH